jgi:hypothetical protein
MTSQQFDENWDNWGDESNWATLNAGAANTNNINNPAASQQTAQV